MPPKQPTSLAVQTPSLTVNVTPSTCHNLTLFKDIMSQYRKLDDTIITSLNRANSQFRDLERAGIGKGTVQEQACAHLWKDLVENWNRRTEIVGYCVNVVDQSLEEKRASLANADADPAEQRKIKGVLYAEEVKRNQIHYELTVEKIVRTRSLQAFRSRCKFFEPPLSDKQAREWWEAAQEGR
ncbi:caffeine-induced death protein 2-domain-containing protein [Irpex rosettiformis]|uniref:Caffeine-induced death protein 2-domain-containing protein n=1 Tax=Irpex rosettiformis TaxID=378272 RepID=A0ACB8UCX2_9APHY|nr:caffeine-induced death protein 2-domain-containing protein [Irpex rosettiformis]